MDNKIDNVLNKIYNEVIDEVLKGIENKFHNIVKQEYYKKLKTEYSTFPLEDKNYEIILNRIIEIEKETWSEMTANEKQHELIRDDNLEKIISLSNSALALAKKRMKTDEVIDKKSYDDIIDKLNKLYNNVHEFNKKTAEWYIITGTSDISFAAGISTYPSTRLRDYNKDSYKK